jgi:hypothetical protein
MSGYRELRVSTIDDLRKLFQDFLAPELRALSEQLKAQNEKTDLRLKTLEEKMEYRFNSFETRLLGIESKIDRGFMSVKEEFATAKRLDRVEQRLGIDKGDAA